jgi:serine/threonine-protein phosphatase 2A regulatory subunit B''
MRRGRISILEILLSPILAEFFELQQPDLSANLLLSNWFSTYSSTKIYSERPCSLSDVHAVQW